MHKQIQIKLLCTRMLTFELASKVGVFMDIASKNARVLLSTIGNLSSWSKAAMPKATKSSLQPSDETSSVSCYSCNSQHSTLTTAYQFRTAEYFS